MGPALIKKFWWRWDGPEDLGALLDALQLLDLGGEEADLLLQLRLAQVHALTQPAEGRHQVPDRSPPIGRQRTRNRKS